MRPKDGERQILRDAVAALEATVGAKAKVELEHRRKGRDGDRTDALLEINLKGQKHHFVAEVKAIDRRIAIAQIRAQLQAIIDQRYPGYHPLLITAFATDTLAEECRKLELPFIDTAGNLYLHTANFMAYIRGQARPANPFKHEYRANNPAGLKITFALLCNPALAAAQYRELATIAKVALGTIGPVLNDLTQRGFLRHGKTPAGTLERRRELLNEWVTYYPANLRPTLHARRYQADREKLMQTDLAPFGAYWGGEYGAEKLTRYLKAERFLIYVPGAPPPILMTNACMRLATDGNTEILQTFWHPDLFKEPTTLAPPLLIYADLMATADPRNIETAKQIYERFLEPTFHQP
jgi:hypothetical protein